MNRGNYGRNLAPPTQDPRRDAKAQMINGPNRQILDNKANQSLQAHVAKVANQSYNALRVYHGVHSDGQNRINQQGLRAQGGPGMSAAIGDQNRAQGHTFVTTDKDQAGYYAKISTEMNKARVMENHNSTENQIDRVLNGQIQPQIMRAILSPTDKSRMFKDYKGGDGDHMIPHNLSSQKMLPGDNTNHVNMAQKQRAVTLMQSEMQKRGATVSTDTAGNQLQLQRRASIANDNAKVNSQYATDGARETVKRARMFGVFRQ
ncbi:hypothetical protein [Planctobacterium marinum]|uniref:hypothetical protein n=1 Tax=Planctobacterium marinum TaxID=1631968 RepID=UPI001E287D30|nr:hypothetical protein [Planctobacterium marinum]MCC2604402.1 hypothetical protein [Planctobacterium marinum]